MDFGDATFNSIISQAGVQFEIPIWQRLYSWDQREWKDLWDDIGNLYERLSRKEAADHFLGPIVTKSTEVKLGNVTKYVLIDGQQRITTLLVMCALIRDIARQRDLQKLADEIQETLLLNKFAKDQEDKFKLLPQQIDRDAFLSIMNRESSTDALSGYGSQIIPAYKFFETLLLNSSDKFDLDNLLSVIKQLRIVTLTLKEKDNPNRIFETLNARGKELDQIDLVKNYLLMAVQQESRADKFYSEIWQPMQKNFGSSSKEISSNMEEFLRHYTIMLSGRDFQSDAVYLETKQRLKLSSETQMIEEMRSISRYSKSYAKLLFTEYEVNFVVRAQIERLNRLDIGVTYPFLLKFYDLLSTEKIDQKTFVELAKVIESYVVRRSVLGLRPNGFNKFFPTLCQLKETDVVNSLKKELAEKPRFSNLYWPKDEEIRNAFVNQDLYHSRRARFILESLEESFGHPEALSLEQLSLEHVMPENLTNEWRAYLGTDAQTIHQRYVHTIGNLTLIAPSKNSSISDKLFARKKAEWYVYSNVELTKEIVNTWNEWNQTSIISRSEMLAEEAIRIWPHPETRLSII